MHTTLPWLLVVSALGASVSGCTNPACADPGYDCLGGNGGTSQAGAGGSGGNADLGGSHAGGDGGGTSNGFPGAGGMGGAGAAPSEACQSYCDRLDELSQGDVCYFEFSASCLSDCADQEEEAVGLGCLAEVDALLSCEAMSPDRQWTCEPSFLGNFDPACAEEGAVLNACTGN
jgi:hypothetical protein